MKYLRSALCGILAGAVVSVSQAQTPKPATTFRVTDAFGDVVRKTGREPFAPLRAGDVLSAPSTLRTGDNAAILLRHSGAAFLRVGANSVVTLDSRGNARLLSGQAWRYAGKSEIILATPSATVRGSQSVFGVGYDLESDQTTVSVDAGKATVSLKSGGWQGAATAGQFVQYLRNPAPNIRLRRPEVAAQPDVHQGMWKLLRAESWTKGKQGKLTRGNETALRQLVRTVEVQNNDSGKGDVSL